MLQLSKYWARFFGFLGGIPLIINQSGYILSLEAELIKGIPIINSYLLPGIWLLVVYGFGCGFAAYGIWNFKVWGWNLALIVSIIWIGWVLFELMIWGVKKYSRRSEYYLAMAYSTGVSIVFSIQTWTKEHKIKEKIKNSSIIFVAISHIYEKIYHKYKAK